LKIAPFPYDGRWKIPSRQEETVSSKTLKEKKKNTKKNMMTVKSRKEDDGVKKSNSDLRFERNVATG